MSVEWYDMIARRNGGYRSNARYTVEGVSGEAVFEERLIKMLPGYKCVLDAGCGHGEFTLKMASYALQIIGFDNSQEMIKLAQALQQEAQKQNTEFVWATTKGELPFADNQFDLIYTRRGPTSILNHGRILRSGGTIFGIHSAELERVRERLEKNGFIDVVIEVFDQAYTYFPDAKEFAQFISAMHGSIDYTLPENRALLAAKVAESQIAGRLGIQEWRYVWSAKKP